MTRSARSYKEQFSEELDGLEIKLAEIKEKLDKVNQHKQDSNKFRQKSLQAPQSRSKISYIDTPRTAATAYRAA